MENVFENVAVTAQANVYFDGKVNSRTIVKSTGEKITLGFMLPGEYEFSTAAKELMEVVNGELQALLPGKDGWETFAPGSSFSIPENSVFKVRVATFADYCCSYAN